MVVISELPGGSNGGNDPNKNPPVGNKDHHEEEEIQEDYDPATLVVIHELPGGSNGGDDRNKNPPIGNEDPHDELENQNENHQEVQEANLPPELPLDVMGIIIARVPRCYHRKLRIVCRAFRHLFTSQDVYSIRLLQDVTEPVLHTLIGFNFGAPSWYYLFRSDIALRLNRIYSLPHMLRGSAAVTIGHKIYLMGGGVTFHNPQTTALVINCRLHTWEYLPAMQKARYSAAAGVIEGKIYVIGGRPKEDNDWVEVFDVNLGVWETVPSQCPGDATEGGLFDTYVVMQGKIFISDPACCLAYEPREGLWQSWGIESQLNRIWSPSSCVITDYLYNLDLTCSLGYPIVVYYPNELVWKPLLGVRLHCLPPMKGFDGWKMANLNGKLVILGGYFLVSTDIVCIEIALETREGGYIWGNVESTSFVYTNEQEDVFPSVELCRIVTV